MVFELLAVLVGDHLVTGRLQDALDHLQLRQRIIDHHDLSHALVLPAEVHPAPLGHGTTARWGLRRGVHLLQTPYQPRFSAGLDGMCKADKEMSWIQGFRAVQAFFHGRARPRDNGWTSVH